MSKIKNFLKQRILNKIEENLMRSFVKDSKAELFLRDKHNNFIKLYHNDNYIYLKENGVISDSYPMMKSMDSIVKDSKVAIDIGANIGITTMWLARNSKSVHCFEPEASNRERIIENLEVNYLKNVIVNASGVSNIIGENLLYIHESKGHHSLAPVGTTPIVNRVKIKLITLDKYCEDNAINEIDILKIDVEGFEEEVLNGAEKLLSKGNIKVIIFEVSKFIIERLNKKESIENIYNILVKNGYTIFSLEKKEMNLEDLKNLKQGDVYALLNKKND
jgi:FkbM family methyltransferase